MAFDFSVPSLDYTGMGADFAPSSFLDSMNLGNIGNSTFDFGNLTTPGIYDFGGFQAPQAYAYSGLSNGFSDYADPTSYTPSINYLDGANIVAGDKPWYEKLGDWASSNPDKAVGAGLGVLNGIGGMMSAIQSNKYAKEAAKRNKQLTAYEKQQMDRMQKNQAVNDAYNYSIDKTTPDSIAYTPLTAEQAMHYGETGAPFQQIVRTPGETTRTQLACGGLAGLAQKHQSGRPLHHALAYGHGGIVDAMQEHSTGRPLHHALAYAHGGNIDQSGQADTVPAMLSGGEYVMDADVVAALGDGNTKAGASALDALRENVRKHKRSASVKSIPPKAKPAASYLPKGEK